MSGSTLYADAHLVVAMIRVLNHQQKKPPTVPEVCERLAFSLEHGQFLCLKLKELGAVEMVEGAYGMRLFIRDHLRLEEIEKEADSDPLENAIAEYRESKKQVSEKVAKFKAAQARKQQELFAELEKKLKKNLPPR